MIRSLITLGFSALLATAMAQESTAPEPPKVSPDGRFEFIAYSNEEANAGKPPFGIVERASGKLIWSAPDELGDASRPEERILWAPDSKRFALVSRVSTRRLGCHLFGFDGKTFVALTWKDRGRLEALADAKVVAAAKAEGVTMKEGRGQVILDDVLPEQWQDADSLIVTRSMDVSLDEIVASGVARVLLRWNAKTKEFSIARELSPKGKS